MVLQFFWHNVFHIVYLEFIKWISKIFHWDIWTYFFKQAKQEWCSEWVALIKVDEILWFVVKYGEGLMLTFVRSVDIPKSDGFWVKETKDPKKSSTNINPRKVRSTERNI